MKGVIVAHPYQLYYGYFGHDYCVNTHFGNTGILCPNGRVLGFVTMNDIRYRFWNGDFYYFVYRFNNNLFIQDDLNLLAPDQAALDSFWEYHDMWYAANP